MEACCGAHHLARQFASLRYDVRLMPPEYVKPYVKSHKNDDRDAEAIAEETARSTKPVISSAWARMACARDLWRHHPVLESGQHAILQVVARDRTTVWNRICWRCGSSSRSSQRHEASKGHRSSRRRSGRSATTSAGVRCLACSSYGARAPPRSHWHHQKQLATQLCFTNLTRVAYETILVTKVRHGQRQKKIK